MQAKHALMSSFMGVLYHVYAYYAITILICCIVWLLMRAVDLSARYTSASSGDGRTVLRELRLGILVWELRLGLLLLELWLGVLV